MQTKVPTEIDGVALGAGALECLGELVLTAVFEAGHTTEDALAIALRAFRKAWQVQEDEWRPLPVIRLGDGHGAVRSRWWLRQTIEEARARAACAAEG